MNHFSFFVDTQILFGSGQLDNLHNVIDTYGAKVLLVYGGGSIKKTGLYDRIISALQGIEVHELSGVEPNPRIETVRRGAALCKEKGVEVILAVGGGSVIDCAKVIAAAVYYDGDPWDFLTGAAKVVKAVPLCTILTLAATGSEMDSGAVISNMETKEKLVVQDEKLIPRVSILDPENTFTVPAIQTAAGAADIMSHVFEVYFNDPAEYIPDSFSESLLKAVIQYAPIALKNPRDYEARAQLMWASTLAINGICSVGKVNAWSCHPIEHELSAHYDITHGIGLAIITPHWMRHILNETTRNRFAEYAINVWGVDALLDKQTQANLGIDKTEAFFRSLGIPMTLSEVSIDAERFTEISEHAVKTGNLQNAYVPLATKDVLAILKASL